MFLLKSHLLLNNSLDVIDLNLIQQCLIEVTAL